MKRSRLAFALSIAGLVVPAVQHGSGDVVGGAFEHTINLQDRAAEIAKNFRSAGTSVGYRKTLAL